MNIAYGVVCMIGYVVRCINDAMYMLDMYRWCCLHVLHVELCIYGVVCMIVQVVLCA